MFTRRDHLKQLASCAALPLFGAPIHSALAGPAPTPTPGSGPYNYLGRTPGYREWAVVPRGLTIKSIETFTREPYALVRITARRHAGMGAGSAVLRRHDGGYAA
jgi:hypothetical protein